jgi:hypothetical protein
VTKCHQPIPAYKMKNHEIDKLSSQYSNVISFNYDITTRIYIMRNTQVMLDKDIAFLYDVKPTRLRE